MARNPSAPPEVVRRLVRRPDTADVVARYRGDLTDELVDALLGLGDAEIAASLGHNDRVLPRVRWRLAEHPDPTVRASAARHAAPSAIVPGREIPPALLAQLAADPDASVRAKAAEHRALPDSAREGLTADPDPHVREVIAARWTNAPAPIHRRLLTDPAPNVRAAALGPWHPVPPADLHAELLADPATRAGVTPYIELTTELAAELAASPDDGVRQSLACNPGLPASIRTWLQHDADLTVRINLLMNRTTPPEVRSALCAELDGAQDWAESWIIKHHLVNAWRDKRSLGWLWDAPLDERLSYLDSPHSFLRSAVAFSPNLPPDAVARLLADPDIATRQIVAYHHEVPGPVLEGLVRDHGGETGHLRSSLVDRPNFPPAAFARFAEATDTTLRWLACRDPNLPAELVATLAADPEPSVRRVALEHPQLPASSLPPFLADDDLNIAELAGAAPALPLSLMTKLLDESGL